MVPLADTPPSLEINMSPELLKLIPSGCGNSFFANIKTDSTLPSRSAITNWLLADERMKSLLSLGWIAAAEG